jgi:hypothetical protein
MAQNPTPKASTSPPAVDADLEAQRETIRIRIVRRALLQTHIFLYILVNAILFAVYNFFANTGDYWFMWALTGWGLALAIHIFATVGKNAGLLSYHIFIYILVNLFLVFVDWFTDGSLNWAYWPILGWGIGLILHIVFYSIYRPVAGEDPNKSWMDRKIEAELKARNLAPTPAPTTSTDPICPKCGKVNVKNAEFCAGCGQSMP